MRSLFKQSFDWAHKWSKSRYSQLVLFVFLFSDASFFPLPTTIIFITISLLYPLRSKYNAVIATIAMVSGAVAGYGIGHYLWLNSEGGYTVIAQYFFTHIPGFTIDLYHNAQALYSKWSYGILFAAIILPIPYQFYSISAGAFDANILMFGFSTLLFQGLRFFGLAYLIDRFGEEVKIMFQKNLKIIAFSSIALLVFYIVVVKILQ
jgi:membrane protein YqaA with SNARE-associated domain